MRSTSRKLALLTVGLLTALLAAACGAQHASSSNARSVSLVLDFTPNAIHTGIYTAIARGYDHAAGIDLHVIVPGASTDAIKLLETGRADFAILDIHDLAIAREHGQSIAGILPIVQRPLAAVIAAPKFHDPKQLQGQTVGVSGAPSDLAVLELRRAPAAAATRPRSRRSRSASTRSRTCWPDASQRRPRSGTTRA